MPHKVRVIPFLDGMSRGGAHHRRGEHRVRGKRPLHRREHRRQGLCRGHADAGRAHRGKRRSSCSARAARARPSAWECALSGAKHITVVNRKRERGEELARVIAENTACAAEYLPWEGAVKIPECDILINATCVGLTPHADEKPDIDYDGIRPGMVSRTWCSTPNGRRFARSPRPRRQGHHGGLACWCARARATSPLWTGRGKRRSRPCSTRSRLNSTPEKTERGRRAKTSAPPAVFAANAPCSGQILHGERLSRAGEMWYNRLCDIGRSAAASRS